MFICEMALYRWHKKPRFINYDKDCYKKELMQQHFGDVTNTSSTFVQGTKGLHGYDHAGHYIWWFTCVSKYHVGIYE